MIFHLTLFYLIWKYLRSKIFLYIVAVDFFWLLNVFLLFDVYLVNQVNQD